MTLDRMGVAGSEVTFNNPSSTERAAILMRYYELREAKHAVVLSDEFHPNQEQLPMIRVFHYRTCTRCLIDSGRSASVATK